MDYGINVFSPALWFKYFTRLLFSFVPPSGLKNFGYRMTGITLGRNVFLGDGVYFIDGYKQRMINLHDGAVLSPRVIVVAAAEPTGSFLRHEYAVSESRPISIEEGAWIGAAAVILPGVTVGRGAIVGANAVVSRSVPPMEVWVGIPARYLKQVESYGRLDPCEGGRSE
jgi:acetyltransferase-like isoleucine patch superfamily enzyme